MPIYEYVCDGCTQVFEVFQKHSDPPPAEHACGSTQIRRQLSQTSFVLKGTGWYATDYGNRKPGSEGGGGKASGEGKTEAGKGEAKAADGKAAANAGAPAQTSKDTGGDKRPPPAKGGKGGGASAA